MQVSQYYSSIYLKCEGEVVWWINFASNSDSLPHCMSTSLPRGNVRSGIRTNLNWMTLFSRSNSGIGYAWANEILYLSGENSQTRRTTELFIFLVSYPVASPPPSPPHTSWVVSIVPRSRPTHTHRAKLPSLPWRAVRNCHF